MLTRKTPDTLATALTIKGQGEEVTFKVVYNNRTQDEIQDVLDKANADERAATDFQFANRQAVLFVVKELEAEYPLTEDGIRDMERDRPGMIKNLFLGFHKAREVELAKN